MMARKTTILELKPEAKVTLWDEADIVWDTSALCRLYSLTPVVRDQMLEILETIHDRLWIPHRVAVEFRRHCTEELKKPLARYSIPKDVVKGLSISAIGDYLKTLTDNPHLHPIVNTSILKNLSNEYAEISEAMDALRVHIQDMIAQGKKGCEGEIDIDRIGQFVYTIECGEDMSYSDLLEIAKEGVWRYEAKIPPGYMDKAEKDSIDRFGDLIIWKAIISHAVESQKPVILVTQDLKEDWNALANNGDLGKSTIVPREELLSEFKCQTGQDMWIYTVSDFLNELKSTCEDIVPGSPYDNLDKLNQELEIAGIPDEFIKIQCDRCNHITGVESDDICWDWETDIHDQRAMGVELCSSTEFFHECPFCGSEIELKFEVFQYPIPVVNHINVEVNGGKEISSPDLDSFCLIDNLTAFKSCEICGEWRNDIDSNGWCESCYDEYNRKINED